MRIERAGYNVYGRLDNADGSVSVKADEAAGRLSQDTGAGLADTGLNASDDSRRAAVMRMYIILYLTLRGIMITILLGRAASWKTLM